MKKILSIILVLLTVLSLMPAAINADTAEPTPTPIPMATIPPNDFYFYTYPATDITSTSARLNGYGEMINYGFGYGDGGGWFYYRQKGETEWKTTFDTYFIWSSVSMSDVIHNLEPNTTYEFYAGGTGSLQGEIMEFTTLPEIPGDPNGDGVCNINDLVYMVEYIGALASGETLDTNKFPNGTFICGLESARITDDEDIDVNDVVLLVEYIGTLSSGATLDPDKFPNGKLPRISE